tara:strand:- start:167 stop:673 length:507 start_codon:yes stop_codon:yes gene_type:complete
MSFSKRVFIGLLAATAFSPFLTNQAKATNLVKAECKGGKNLMLNQNKKGLFVVKIEATKKKFYKGPKRKAANKVFKSQSKALGCKGPILANAPKKQKYPGTVGKFEVFKQKQCLESGGVLTFQNNKKGVYVTRIKKGQDFYRGPDSSAAEKAYKDQAKICNQACARIK